MIIHSIEAENVLKYARLTLDDQRKSGARHGFGKLQNAGQPRAAPETGCKLCEAQLPQQPLDAHCDGNCPPQAKNASRVQWGVADQLAVTECSIPTLQVTQHPDRTVLNDLRMKT